MTFTFRSKPLGPNEFNQPLPPLATVADLSWDKERCKVIG